MKRRALWAAVIVLAVHTAGLVVAGIFLLVRTGSGGSHNTKDATAEGIFVLLGAVIFAMLTRGLAPPLVRYAARTPALLLELIMLPVAVGLVQSGRPELGIPLAGSALIAVGGILAGTMRASGAG